LVNAGDEAARELMSGDVLTVPVEMECTTGSGGVR
jgi:hypothetical protein